MFDAKKEDAQPRANGLNRGIETLAGSNTDPIGACARGTSPLAGLCLRSSRRTCGRCNEIPDARLERLGCRDGSKAL
jgi:hypothetical protein